MRDEYLREAIDLLFRLPRIMRMSLHREVFKPVLKSFNENLAPHHMMILKTLEEEGVLYIAEIGENVAISKAQMTHSIDELIAIGMVERQNDYRDRRKTNIKLTDKGKLTVEKMDAMLRKHIEEKLSDITDIELAKLIDVLNYLEVLFGKWE
jgi:DNA-binding MarR family transcriptional regulator